MTRLKQAFQASFSSRNSFIVTVTVAVMTFSLMILGSFPLYTYQMITRTPFLFFTALQALTMNLYNSAGLLAVVLTVVYAFVAGVAVSNLVSRFRMTEASGVKEAGLLSPGILVSGCASCGAGLLGLIGLGGALATLPFQGNLVRLGGIALILLFLHKSGDPTACSLD